MTQTYPMQWQCPRCFRLFAAPILYPARTDLCFDCWRVLSQALGEQE